jgi:hypothetical protein
VSSGVVGGCGGGGVVGVDGDTDCWTGAATGGGAVVVVGAGGVGAGAGEGFGGVGVGLDVGGGDGVERGAGAEEAVTCEEISVAGEWRTTGACTTCLTAAGRCAVVRWCGTIRTTGGAGAGWMMRGVAAMRSSTGELDSNAARQRYPEVTPAATSRQSRSASNEIRTRISIGLP